MSLTKLLRHASWRAWELRACRVKAHSTFSRAKRMSASVPALPDWRFSVNARPTLEKRRSTVADVAGQLR